MRWLNELHLQPGDPLTVIVVGVVALFAIVVALSVIVLLHHVVTDNRRRRNRERFESAAVTLAPLLVGTTNGLDTAVRDARRHNGDRAVGLVLRKARIDLKGDITDRIAEILEKSGEVKKLLREAKSRREWRRAAAVRGLGECGGVMARRKLIEAACEDAAGEVRRTARDGLLNDGTPEAVHAAIQSFLEDLPRRASWRRTFYARLAFVAADQLTTLIRSGELKPVEEKLAIEALGDAGRRSALSLAVERLTSPDPEMRATAVRVIGKVGREAEMILLIEALNDIEWYVRAAAARGMEWMLTRSGAVTHAGARQTAFEKLAYRLTDASWWVRANAARALAHGGGAGVVQLLRAAESSDRYARDASVAALAMATLTPEARLTVKNKIDALLTPDEKPAAPETVKRPGGLFA
jgi:HEAT repeat protein